MTTKQKIITGLDEVSGGEKEVHGDWIWEKAWAIKKDENIGPEKRVYFVDAIEDDGLCLLDRYDFVDGECVGPENDHEFEPRNLKVVGKPAWVIEK